MEIFFCGNHYSDQFAVSSGQTWTSQVRHQKVIKSRAWIKLSFILFSAVTQLTHDCMQSHAGVRHHPGTMNQRIVLCHILMMPKISNHAPLPHFASVFAWDRSIREQCYQLWMFLLIMEFNIHEHVIIQTSLTSVRVIRAPVFVTSSNSITIFSEASLCVLLELHICICTSKRVVWSTEHGSITHSSGYDRL